MERWLNIHSCLQLIMINGRENSSTTWNVHIIYSICPSTFKVWQYKNQCTYIFSLTLKCMGK